MQELSNYIEKTPIEDENKALKETDNFYDSVDSMVIKESQLTIRPQKTLSFKKPQTTFKTVDLTTKSLNFEPGQKQQQPQDDKRSSKYDRYAFGGSNGQRTPTKTRSKLIESEGKRIENAILKAPAACHSILKVIELFLT